MVLGDKQHNECVNEIEQHTKIPSGTYYILVAIFFHHMSVCLKCANAYSSQAHPETTVLKSK